MLTLDIKSGREELTRLPSGIVSQNSCSKLIYTPTRCSFHSGRSGSQVMEIYMVFLNIYSPSLEEIVRLNLFHSKQETRLQYFSLPNSS